MGHDVLALEPEGNWSLANLLSDHGEEGLAAYRQPYPERRAQGYGMKDDLVALVDGADLVVVHDWNAPSLGGALGLIRAGRGAVTVRFHDTQHRAAHDTDVSRA